MANEHQSAAKRDFDTLCQGGVLSGPTSEEAVNRAQTELGVVLPNEYREFLLEHGAALVSGAEIYGLPDLSKNDPPLWTSVISVTKQLREYGQAGTESGGNVPIADDGMGVYFFLNTQASPGTEIWAIGPGIEKLVSNRFYDFVLDLAEGRVNL